MSKNNLPRFIVNTEYASLKNFPATITITVNISAGGTLGAGNYSTNVTTGNLVGITIPKGAPLQSMISTSINPNTRFQENVLQFTENGGLSNQYEGLVLVTMSAENTVAVTVSLYNPQFSSVTTNARQIVVTVRPFVPPFS